MPVFTCPNCDWQTPDVSVEYSGRNVRCQQCEQLFRLPQFAPPASADEDDDDDDDEGEEVSRPRWGLVTIWGIALIQAMLAVLVTWLGLVRAESAIQETTVIALGLATAIIPYCMARAITEIANHASGR